jgi:hypothetical protein
MRFIVILPQQKCDVWWFNEKKCDLWWFNPKMVTSWDT